MILKELYALDFRTKLESGLRYFDVRTKQIYDELQIWHGIIDQHYCLDNIIQDMVTFLGENPSEFIMMRLNDYNEAHEGRICLILSTPSFPVIQNVVFYAAYLNNY